MRFEIRSRSKLTDLGAAGAVGFIACPVVSAFFYAGYLHGLADPYRIGAPSVVPLLFSGLFGILWLGSMVMLFIGRTWDHEGQMNRAEETGD